MRKPVKTFKPGRKAPVSGQYAITSPGQERTVVKGERIPPTQGKAMRYTVTRSDGRTVTLPPLDATNPGSIIDFAEAIRDNHLVDG